MPPATRCLVLVAALHAHAAWHRAVLGDRERARADRLLTPAAATASVLARVLVRLAAATGLDDDPAAVDVRARCPRCGGPHGPPWVPDLPWRWSVAHGGELVIVAVAPDGGPVGVDVEPRGTAVPAGFAAADRDRLARWVEVEAVTKLAGDGLTVPLEQVHVARGRVTGYPGRLPPGVRVRSLDPGPRHVAALATVGAGEVDLVDTSDALVASAAAAAADRLRGDVRLW